ncbi:MAG: tyrosine-protein phosphatase [Ruminococcaceae bacterium]|nr:tyrosine-protein phosphatase [Oscillospiraceae bacterium]
MDKKRTVRLKEYGDPIDILEPNVRDFVNAAKNYDTNDYSYTIVENYFDFPPNPLPIRLEWEASDPEEIVSTKLFISINEDLSDAREYRIEGNSLYNEIINPYTDTVYYWQAEVFYSDGSSILSDISSFKIAEGPRLIYIDHIYNIRDLGGYHTAEGSRTKQGLLYRSQEMNNEHKNTVTEMGTNEAVNVLGIRTDIDLRNINEHGVIFNSSPLGDGIKYIKEPAPFYSEAFNSPVTGKIFEYLCDIENYPLVFHCVGGADRTGTLAFLVNGLLGVSENELICDYELTGSRNRASKGAAYGDNHTLVKDFINKIKSLEGNSLQEKIFNFYHKKIGVSLMAISNLRNIMLNDSAVFRSESIRSFSVTEKGYEFYLDMRDSDGIRSISVDGEIMRFFENDGRVYLITEHKTVKREGIILFNDGSTLFFEI